MGEIKLSLDRLDIEEYAEKFRFLVGRNRNEPHGRLKALIDDLLPAKDEQTPEQAWVRGLLEAGNKIDQRIRACELYNQSGVRFDLETVLDAKPVLTPQAHADWMKPENRGPERAFGFALACIHGFGCTTDDPNLPMAKRRALWDAFDCELWKTWLNESAENFVASYKEALTSDSLDFPPRVRDAMTGHTKVPDKKETSDVARELQSDAETRTNTVTRPTDASVSSDPWTERPWHRAMWAALVGGLAAILLAVILLPKPPQALRGASIWVECLPGAGQVEILAGSELAQEECPENGLLPVASAALIAGEIMRVEQAPFDVPLAPHALSYPFASKVIWRPSPSFAWRLTERESLVVALACGREDARVVLNNDDWGERVLTCASPVTRFPVLGPEELRVALTVTAPTSSETETCSGYFQLFDDSDITMDPTRACAQLSEVPLWTLPTRDFVTVLDVVEDTASGLTWLEDPFAFGNTARWSSNNTLASDEFLSHVERETGLNGWRLASPAEVAAVDPSIFRRAGGSENVVLGATQDPNCDSGARKMALSTDPNVLSVDLKDGVAIPCLFVGPRVGFWIVLDP